MKQVVGKWRNKNRYLYSFSGVPARWSRTLESMIFTLFGLHTRRPSRDCCSGKLSFFIPSNKILIEFSWTYFPYFSHKKCPSKCRHWQDTWYRTKPNAISARLHTVNKTSISLSPICLSSNPANHYTRPHLISPEPQSSTPARHLILITLAFLNTSTSALHRPISFQHSWTLTPIHSVNIVQYSTYLLCHPQCVLLVLYPPPPRVILLFQSWESRVCPHPWSPGPVSDTIHLIWSSPSKVSTLQLFTCFLLFTKNCH